MLPTLVRLSKASRRPLTTKRGNKDYYKGTRQAFLPGGHRTGAPGKHVIGGKAKYRLVDEKVRVYVAPPIAEILSSPLRPYVHTSVRLSKSEERAVFGKFRGPRGLTPEHFLKVAREYTLEAFRPEPEAEKNDSLLLRPSEGTSAPDTTAMNTDALSIGVTKPSSPDSRGIDSSAGRSLG